MADGQRFLVHRVDVGLEAKMLLDAIAEAQKANSDLCVMLFSVDAIKGKALAVAVRLFSLNPLLIPCQSVPESLTTQIKAGDWIKSTLPIIGGVQLHPFSFKTHFPQARVAARHPWLKVKDPRLNT